MLARRTSLGEKRLNPRTINRLSVVLLGFGLGTGVAIYFLADPEVFDPLLGNPLNSQKHLHVLRVMGGRANVTLAEFQAWFVSRWRGPQLGLTVLVVPVFRVIARNPALFDPRTPTPPPPPTAHVSE